MFSPYFHPLCTSSLRVSGCETAEEDCPATTAPNVNSHALKELASFPLHSHEGSQHYFLASPTETSLLNTIKIATKIPSLGMLILFSSPLTTNRKKYWKGSRWTQKPEHCGTATIAEKILSFFLCLLHTRASSCPERETKKTLCFTKTPNICAVLRGYLGEREMGNFS